MRPKQDGLLTVGGSLTRCAMDNVAVGGLKVTERGRGGGGEDIPLGTGYVAEANSLTACSWKKRREKGMIQRRQGVWLSTREKKIFLDYPLKGFRAKEGMKKKPRNYLRCGENYYRRVRQGGTSDSTSGESCVC